MRFFKFLWKSVVVTAVGAVVSAIATPLAGALAATAACLALGGGAMLPIVNIFA